jgi:hypothetical protein
MANMGRNDNFVILPSFSFEILAEVFPEKIFFTSATERFTIRATSY